MDSTTPRRLTKERAEGYCLPQLMRKTRTIVAVTLLATALCADRSVSSAAQTVRADAEPAARGFAQRLTVHTPSRIISGNEVPGKVETWST